MRKVDLTDKRFGHLYVLSEAPSYISPKGYKKTMWNCRCDCGNKCVAMGSHLTTGHTVSCGCLQQENLKPRKAVDLKGNRFGLLTVMYRQPNRIKKNYSRIVWHCKCDCGRETDVLGLNLTGGLVKSCGCLNISHAERVMLRYLDKMKISYDFQYSPDDLCGIGGGKLSFDFVLHTKSNGMILVELDGLQHFESVAYFGGDEKYKRMKFNDFKKDNYCLSKNLLLIRIDVRNCTTDESFLRLYELCLSSYIDELTNSLNI